MRRTAKGGDALLIRTYMIRINHHTCLVGTEGMERLNMEVEMNDEQDRHTLGNCKPLDDLYYIEAIEELRMYPLKEAMERRIRAQHEDIDWSKLTLDEAPRAIIKNQVDIDPEFVDAVDEAFWDILA